MKKPFPILLIVLIAAIVTLTAAAEGNDRFTYEITGGQVCITGCDKSLDFVQIPSMIEGCPVTSIGEKAFISCENLVGVAIPEGVRYIGDSAFEDCVSLLDITIPLSVSQMGNNVFRDCTSLANITIPASIKRISDYAFDNCRSLRSVTICDGIARIGEGAFIGCESLEQIHLPDSVNVIESLAFSGCVALISIDIPKNVTRLGAYAFSGCKLLKTITVSDTVTGIDNDAFVRTAYYDDRSNWKRGELYVDGRSVSVDEGYKSLEKAVILVVAIAVGFFAITIPMFIVRKSKEKKRHFVNVDEV